MGEQRNVHIAFRFAWEYSIGMVQEHPEGLKLNRTRHILVHAGVNLPGPNKNIIKTNTSYTDPGQVSRPVSKWKLDICQWCDNRILGKIITWKMSNDALKMWKSSTLRNDTNKSKYLKMYKLKLRSDNLACSFVWVWILVSHIMG
jgi:hypothetical protein